MTISTHPVSFLVTMTAHYTSSVIPKYKNNLRFWNNQNNMFSSSYSKILHDPECQSDCCSKNFVQPMQANNSNNMEQFQNVSACYSDEVNLISTTNGTQFLYNVTNTKDQVPEFQEDIGHVVADNLGMAYSPLCFEKPIERTQYSSCFTNISSSEASSKRRSYCKGVIKRKRNRTVFTTEQIIVMEGVFKKRPYVSKEERLFLTQRLNLSEKAIKVWFQNRRRVTEKREKDQSDSCHSDSTVEEVCNDFTTRLDYIESQINQNTDEYGFVRLNNYAFSELVKLIDDVLSRNFETDNSMHKIKNNVSSSMFMYEPVSPDSSPDDNKDSDDLSKWKPSKPEESLQRLIDIQTVLYG